MVSQLFAGPLSAIAWSPTTDLTGARLAVGCVDSRILIRDAFSDEVTATLVGHTGWVRGVAFKPDGTTLASGSHDGSVRLWNPDTGQQSHELRGHGGVVRAVAFSSDGKRLSSAGDDGSVRLWNPETGRQTDVLIGHAGIVRAVGFSPDGEWLLSAGDDGSVRLWDPGNGLEIQSLAHPTEIWDLAISPHGEILATAGRDAIVRLWNIGTGELIRELLGHTEAVRSVSFSRDGEQLASGSEDATVRVWNPDNGHSIHELVGHRDIIRAVSFQPAGQTLASASLDGTVRLWDTAAGQETRLLAGHTDLIYAVAFSPDGEVLAAAGLDNTVQLWSPATLQQIQRFEHVGPAMTVSFSPDSTTLASGGADAVRLWDVVSSTQISESTTSSATRTLAFSPDGDLLASAGDDGVIRLRDPKSGVVTRSLVGHRGRIWAICFSPDNLSLASSGDDNTVRIWSLPNGNQSHELSHPDEVRGVAFSPDGLTLATGGRDGLVRLWSADTGQETHQLAGHSGPVRNVVFSSDGRHLASASEDHTVRTWNPLDGRLDLELLGHNGWVWGLAFSPEGGILASASQDGTVRLWNSASGEPEGWLPDTWEGQVRDGSSRPASEVGQLHDHASTEDLLGRTPMAGAIAGQLLALFDSDPTQSFAIHITGYWGSGKTSLVNVIVATLKAHTKAGLWTLPDPNRYFDAWRASQVGPAWWALLTWLRTTVRNAQRSWWRRRLFEVRELVHRWRLAGLMVPTILSSVLLTASTFLVGVYVWQRVKPGGRLLALDGLFGLVGAAFATIAVLLAVGTGLGRWLTWRTPAGARTFQRRDDNPMDDVVHHAQWLRAQVDGPILLVLDDLDRCSADFVVELLDATQTILRPDVRDTPPLIVLVAADERWVHAAFDKAYTDFKDAVSSPGRSLGHLFLAKLFQLQVRVPPLDQDSAIMFGRKKLGLSESSGKTDEFTSRSASRSAVERIERTDDLDRKIAILHDLTSTASEASDYEGLMDAAVAVGRTAMSIPTQLALKHELEDYFHLLEPTPRAVVRFINTYAIQRISTHAVYVPESRPTSESLARWAILELRWPEIALRLIADPDLLDAWHSSGPESADRHLSILRSVEFQNVTVGVDGVPALTGDDIQRCLGMRMQGR